MKTHIYINFALQTSICWSLKSFYLNCACIKILPSHLLYFIVHFLHRNTNQLIYLFLHIPFLLIIILEDFPCLFISFYYFQNIKIIWYKWKLLIINNIIFYVFFMFFWFMFTLLFIRTLIFFIWTTRILIIDGSFPLILPLFLLLLLWLFFLILFF